MPGGFIPPVDPGNGEPEGGYSFDWNDPRFSEPPAPPGPGDPPPPPANDPWDDPAQVMGSGATISFLIAPFEFEQPQGGGGSDQNSYMDDDPDGSEALLWFNEFRAQFAMPSLPDHYADIFGSGNSVDIEFLEAVDRAISPRPGPPTIIANLFSPETVFVDAAGNIVSGLEALAHLPASLASQLAGKPWADGDEIVVTGPRRDVMLDLLSHSRLIKTGTQTAQAMTQIQYLGSNPQNAAAAAAWKNIMLALKDIEGLVDPTDTSVFTITADDGTTVSFSMKEFAYILSRMDYALVLGMAATPTAAGRTDFNPATGRYFAVMSPDGAIGYNNWIDLVGDRFYLVHEVSHHFKAIKALEAALYRQWLDTNPPNRSSESWEDSAEHEQIEKFANTAARLILLDLDRWATFPAKFGFYDNTSETHPSEDE